MIRWTVEKPYTNGTVYAEGFCDSGDTKPSKIGDADLITGSCLIAIDATNNKLIPYFWNEEDHNWTNVQGGDS